MTKLHRILLCLAAAFTLAAQTAPPKPAGTKERDLKMERDEPVMPLPGAAAKPTSTLR